MNLITHIVMYVFLMTKTNCKIIKTTLPIHGSIVPTTGWASSCALIEEGVPICQDPDETDENKMQPVVQTPYPKNGFNAVKESVNSITDWKIRTWWYTGPKQKYDDKKTIFTYLMKGCSPTEIPFNLSPCSVTDFDDQQATKYTITSTRVIYFVPPLTTKLSTDNLNNITSRL